MKRIVILSIISFLSAALFTGGAAAQTPERSSSLVTIEGSGYYVHTVGKGETIYSLSKLYEVTQNEIRRANPHISDGLNEGEVVKIPARLQEASPKLSTRKQLRTFDVHYVNKGETLYSISRRYEIPVNTLLEDNPGLDPSLLSIGQGLNIRKKSRGEATPEQIEEQINDYRDAINSLPTGFIYHIVERGETIFGLSKLYDVTEQDILDNNTLQDGLRAGDMIKIPSREGQRPLVDIELPEEGEPVEELPAWDSPGFVGGFEGGPVRSFVGAPKAALLLPLKTGEETAANFIEFYQGFLLGLEDLKKEGISAEVSLYNTSRSSPAIYGITESEDFAGTNLIIGPVYEENLPPVLQYAGRYDIPVVSPLAPMSRVGSPLLYQMAPDRNNKYDKLKAILAGDVNVIFISSRYKDEEMENEIRPILTSSVRTVELSGTMTAAQISGLLDRSRENLIFISCTNAIAADQIMATISSVQNNLVARSQAAGGIRVVVTPRWARFGANVERDLYFKLNLCYIANYHADRGSDAVRLFDSRFIDAYGKVPTQYYAYRGYDAAVLFIGSAARGGNFNEVLNSGRLSLLQMPYRFSRRGDHGTMVNEEWALVCYRSDYTIHVQ
ncbi:MAG: LysM peptidoglycan-binding domain-containing protein [Rikenellaceae bacterium]|nr:LysM peptidoglycan-binding domain-containing protein [Rikenellaceae bacterium]